MSPGQLQTWVLKTTAFFSFPLHPPPPPTQAPGSWVRFQAALASVVGSEAAIPQELEGFQIQPSGCLGPSPGMPSAGLTSLVVPVQISLGLSQPIANFPKAFIIHAGERGLLGIVSACPLMSKAGFGCVWEVGL